MGVQEITLATSIVFLVASFYLLATSKPAAKWIYMIFVVAWIANIAFYLGVLYFGLSGHDWSTLLRLFTNGCFGTWLIISSCEKFYETGRLKNLKTRMKRHGSGD